MPQRFSNESDIEFRTTEIKPFKIFDSLKECITEASMLFSEKGIKILSLDMTTVNTLIHLDLRAEQFDHYFVEEIERNGNKYPIDLSISIQNLNKVLKTAQPTDDSMTWFHERGKDYLTIVFSNSAKKEERAFDIKLQEPDEESQMHDIEGIDEYNYVVTMPCTDFQKICKDLKQMNADVVTIEHDCQLLAFETKSDIAGKTRIVRHGFDVAEGLSPDSNLIMVKKPEDKSCYRDRFKFECLNNFSKCATIGCKTVQICMKQSMPIVLIFKVGTLGELTFGLSPKTDDD